VHPESPSSESVTGESSSLPALLADGHLHFEGSLPYDVVGRLARRAGHAFADAAAFRARRDAVADMAGFLRLYASICRLFRGPDDYAEAARALPAELARGGLAYAEIYVSPGIFTKMGLDAGGCLEAIESVLRDARPTCRILLDAVRQWGPESADEVLDLYEKRPLPSIVGFGMGGEETALPASAFAGVYARARALGLKTSVHAGEWGGAESMREALDALRPDRVDHGIAAASDPSLVSRLAEERTVLHVAPTGNVRTGAVSGWEAHPLRRLLEAGVRVALSADDPLLFDTTTRDEYEAARERLGVGTAEVLRMQETAWEGAALGAEERQTLRQI
jgi:adenosine deaminase